MDDYEPPPLYEFIRRVENLVVTRVIDALEKELA